MNAISTVTALFTDVVSSTRLRTSQGDVSAHRTLVGHEVVLREAIASHAGREIKTMGDGFMVVFASARQAVGCAISMQRALDGRRRTEPGAEIHVRIGIHTGDVIEEGDDVCGAAVVAAKRIMDRAKGGEILISEMVRGVSGSAAEFNVVDRGRFALKGFDARWRLYEVPWQEEVPPISRRELTVVVTDMKGSTATAYRLGDDAAFSLMRSHNAIVRAQASMHHGEFVKSLGDGFLLAFERPADALACAAAIQRGFADYRREEPAEPLHVRAVVHAGRFIVEAGDLYGQDLFAAFRLLAKVAPGQVLVTDAVRSRVDGSVRFGPAMAFELDNISAPQTVYVLDRSAETARACSNGRRVASAGVREEPIHERVMLAL